MGELSIERATEEETTSPPSQPLPKRRGLGRLGRGVLLRFAVFATLAIGIMLFSGVYTAWRQVEDVRSLQQQIATWSANSIDAWYTDLANDLRSASQNPALLDLPPDEVEAYLRQVLAGSPTFRRVILVDARAGKRGIALLEVQKEETSSGDDYGGTEWFSPTLSQHHYASSVHYQAGMPAIVLAQAIQENGSVVGVLAAQVDVSWAYRLLGQFRMPERGSYIYVVDRHGRPILHDQTAFVSTRESYLDQVPGVHSAVMGETMPLLYRGLNASEQRVIGSYKSVQNLPWFAIAEQPLPWLSRHRLVMAPALGGTIVLGALAAAVVGWYIARRIANPIVQLRAGARQIGLGDLEHRITLPGQNELADLAEELNRMAANLHAFRTRQQAWSRQLETRVAERTRELSQALEEQKILMSTIRQMSNPVIPLMEGIVVTPIVGTLDSERAQQLMSDVLAVVERDQARVAILDITGLAVVDTAVANALIQTARSAQLLGARAILVGISPEAAETLVHLGFRLEDLHTAATLQEGLRLGLKFLHRRVVRA